ncbi:MAG: hypothetical protein CFE23_16700 [Flavobacterium sp. BFFFF1]|nr:MAG: hypothetical protein CFE23_16700 [Flavobacterium sp. BFFFF1]
MLSCKSNLDQSFEKENEDLKNEYKSQHRNFLEANSSKLSAQQMVNSMDSITEIYSVTKNKALATKYVESKSGIKRLNFLKKHFKKNELKSLLKRVPKSIQKDTNYISIKTYVEN